MRNEVRRTYLFLLEELDEDIQSPLVNEEVVSQSAHLTVQLYFTLIQDAAGGGVMQVHF